jgi:uncharacterized protein
MKNNNHHESGVYIFDALDHRFAFNPETTDIRPSDHSSPDLPDLSESRITGRLSPVRAISLAVAQSCNLACTYCYAEGGQFGKKAQLMDKAVAFAAIQQLIESTPAGEHVNIAYMGGEPLLNRKLVHGATRYAVAKGLQHGVNVDFSITTNGSLLNENDIELFKSHRFSVTISMDGTPDQHDAQRPLANGSGSYRRIADKIAPLLRNQDDLYVGARVTVTPSNMNLTAALDSLQQLGFRDIGFSPMINAPDQRGELDGKHLKEYLKQMISCADHAFEQIERGEKPGFSNFTTALNEIHSGKAKTHPCGAGNGYVGIGSDANLYLCHRYINDDSGRIGDVLSGVDSEKQRAFVEFHAVDNQSNCATCWARRLCGGGCYHEVAYRGRPTCEFIRGWLDYCLRAYIKVRMTAPAYFDDHRVGAG